MSPLTSLLYVIYAFFAVSTFICFFGFIKALYEKKSIIVPVFGFCLIILFSILREFFPILKLK